MILNLFKSKPYLKELIPKGSIDIHSHILPGIDDGAKNVKESLELIAEMKKIGFSKIIATPHTYTGLYDNTEKTIKESFDLISNKVNNKIECASEYLIDYSLIKKIEDKSVLCLSGNKILVEMSYIIPPNNLHEIIHLILINGYTPIIAHPERYQYYHNNFRIYQKLKKIGCKFQMNLLSLVGYYGKNIISVSKKLIKNNLIDYVGSDIHNLNHCKQFDKKIKIDLVGEIETLISNNLNDFK